MIYIAAVVAVVVLGVVGGAEAGPPVTCVVGMPTPNFCTAPGGDQTQSQTQTQTVSQSQAVSVNGGGGGHVTRDIDIPRQAPAVWAPALAVAPETCMGSTSGGASTPFGGLSFGTSWKSDDCELRMFARALQALGQPGAALILLGQNNERVRRALEAAGVVMPPRP